VKKIKVSPMNSQFIFAKAAYLLAKTPTKKVKKKLIKKSSKHS
jgi:hypothetical protein